MGKTIISMIHEHSLDNNDFMDKHIYQTEVDGLLCWLKTEHPIFYNHNHIGEWVGRTGHWEFVNQELIHFEP
jgi:hypothetical protein